MKRSHKILTLGALASLVIPFAFSAPVVAQLQQVGQSITQNLQGQARVDLQLSADKKVTTTDEKGQPKVTWESLSGQAVVQPGDTLRYSVNGKNNANYAVNNLAVTQPIPNQMKYVLNTANAANPGTEITYSIDGGKTFVANPTIQVTLPDGKVETRPAPAEAYTHVRWSFGSANAGATIAAAYNVEVR